MYNPYLPRSWEAREAFSSEPPPPPPPMVSDVMNASHEAGTGISLLVSMTYQSLSGNMRSRDVLIRRIIQAKGEYYIDGVAMDKKAPRLIKLSHIQEIRDISSGRVYSNAFEFIRDRLGINVQVPQKPNQQPQPINQFSKVVERTGHEMTVLMYLVAIDGHRNKVEREKVLNYIKSRTTDLTYSDKDLEDYLISLAPDEDCFSAALTQVLSKDPAVVQRVIEAILDVIMADGKVDDRERAFLLQIMDLLEADGYDITLPI